MRTLAKGMSLLLLLFVYASATFAQVQVVTRPLTNTLEVFFLKDFDINSPATSRPIFFVDLINDAQARKIILCVIVQSDNHGELSRGETIPFSLKASERLTISSSQLFSNSGPYRFNNFSIADDAVDDLLENILATGKLPTDIYTFETIVKDIINRTTLDNDSFEIRISNPTTLDLIGPGSPASGRIDDCAMGFSNLPQFRWASNMTRFRFIMAEWKPGEDPESALNQEPRFTRIFLLQNTRNTNLREIGKDLGFNDRVEVIPSTAFTYPSAANLVLRPGKTYVWRVIGLVSTSSGPTSVANEVYCFRIPKLDELGNYMQQFESILRPLLGSDYEKLFGSGGEFSGYKPKRILLDGKEVTLIEILTKLQKLTSKYRGYAIE